MFTPNPAGLAICLYSPVGTVGQYVARKVEQVEQKAQVLAPVDTGKLKSSIVGRVIGPPVRGQVEATAPYSLAVHEGTSPHTITPNTAQVLRFPSRAGAIVYATSVNHPGTRAQPFLWNALKTSFRP
jgi:hypothetical protein